MMRDVQPVQYMLLLAFWSVPMILPISSLLLWEGREIEPRAWGIEWLSMPRAFLEDTNPPAGLGIWAARPGPEEKSPEETPSIDPLESDSLENPAGKPRIPFLVMSGVIQSGEKAVYCFVDTETGRWFRLSEGETDEVSGLSLLRAPGEEGLCLVDGAGVSSTALRIDALTSMEGQSF